MIEFTGERVVPGKVNADLWAEHTARYAFAAAFAAGKTVLDAGCGTGYGCAELAANAAAVVGVDTSTEAIDYARGHASAGQISYVQASVTAMPFAAAAFSLVTAFEVIEHLSDWRSLLLEARRVLRPEGVFLVSTPNRLYYAESRARDGPNPYHVHEFEYEEFRAALAEFFPHTRILLQNRVESFAFYGAESSAATDVRLDNVNHQPEHGHFFLGICRTQPVPDPRPFVYVPRAANVLREREHHIHKLERELEQTKRWLAESIADHAKLQSLHEELSQHLEEKNRWALELERLWKEAQQRVVQLQDEFAAEQANAAAVVQGYEGKVRELEQENLAKTAWAIDTETRMTSELTARAEKLASTLRSLHKTEATLAEKTELAGSLTAQVQRLNAQLEMIRESRWVRLGRTFGVGPKVTKE